MEYKAQQRLCDIQAGEGKVAAGCSSGALQKQFVKIGGAESADFSHLLHGKRISIILLDQFERGLARVVGIICRGSAAGFV